jgi:hypothetical protein
VFLWISNDQSKIKKTIYSSINMKYWGINLTKHMQEPCTKNYKTLLKKKNKQTKYLKKWREVLRSAVRDLLSFQMVNALPIKISTGFLCRDWQADSEVHVEIKRILRRWNNFEKKIKLEVLLYTLSDFL